MDRTRLEPTNLLRPRLPIYVRLGVVKIALNTEQLIDGIAGVGQAVPWPNAVCYLG